MLLLLATGCLIHRDLYDQLHHAFDPPPKPDRTAFASCVETEVPDRDDFPTIVVTYGDLGFEVRKEYRYDSLTVVHLTAGYNDFGRYRTHSEDADGDGVFDSAETRAYDGFWWTTAEYDQDGDGVIDQVEDFDPVDDHVLEVSEDNDADGVTDGWVEEEFNERWHALSASYTGKGREWRWDQTWSGDQLVGYDYVDNQLTHHETRGYPLGGGVAPDTITIEEWDGSGASTLTELWEGTLDGVDRIAHVHEEWSEDGAPTETVDWAVSWDCR